MGCTQSSAVENTNKTKPVFAMNPEPAGGAINENILMGQVEQGKYIFGSVKLSQKGDIPVEVGVKKIPQLVNNNKEQKFKAPNFGQLTRIGASGMYLLTGGINFKLDDIYQAVYLFDSNKSKVFRLPNMKQGRYTHAATYVDGYVYVIGGRYFGEDHQALLNKCERLQIKGQSDQQIQLNVKESLKWQDIASMNVSRCSHIVAVYNKRIYAFGGYSGEFQRSSLIQYYDYKLKGSKWVGLNVGLPLGIQSSIAYANNDNQITVFGGNTNSGPTDIVLTLNLLQGLESIHSNKKMAEKKILHKGYLQKKQSSVVMLGGSEQLSVQIYKFDNFEGENKQKKVLYKNILSKYFTSQTSFESLTNSANTIEIPFNPKPVAQNYVKSDEDQIVYVFGTSTQPFILELNISVPYTVSHPMPLSIKLYALQGAVHVKKTNQYLLFGGITDSQQEVSNQTYIYNPIQPYKKSGRVAKMLTPRYAFGYEIIGDWVYAIGGGSADEEGEVIILNKCERINISKLPTLLGKQIMEWDPIADLPFALISSMTLNYKNDLYAFGGMKSNKERNKHILKYKQTQNKWEQLQFSFQFGLEASSIYQTKQNQYLIFGGRVVNGDTKSIWGLTFINNGQDCVFQQRGQMKQEKCLHHVYKPRHQDFIVVLGGNKEVVSYYDCKNLKPIQSDVLTGMKELFIASLTSLSDKTLRNYTVAMKL